MSLVFFVFNISSLEDFTSIYSNIRNKSPMPSGTFPRLRRPRRLGGLLDLARRKFPSGTSNLRECPSGKEHVGWKIHGRLPKVMIKFSTGIYMAADTKIWLKLKSTVKIYEILY